jgi:hypothetical protein
LQELPEHLLHQTNIKTFNEDEETLRCIEIQYSTSVSQLQSEGNLYYRAPFGLNGRELLSSEEIAANLKVTKVNITFTKTRIIRMLRHSSLSNKILNGI